ncbi:UDP-N-acetylglucosamine (UAA) transporter family [Actinidia rufa]|uniref:UDP-N-acetylglucosamine (UAA) transporter family n=1 Tax=Actinidia rufa TaxID=165716 RepID=A0A7J0DLH7_9ERIC|nr:UDP-N-acetylglucosamine (UAA) transporter family [Actinidia rufa]
MAIDFVARHNDCFFDIALLSTVATASQFFISYTIRTFGALTFATIMTTRQAWDLEVYSLPSWEQCIGAVVVFGSLYAKSFLRNKPQKPSPAERSENGETSPLKGTP